ncbi:MAG: hypothetical protein K0B16_18260, partial [Burkholderiaceae bacterium]|nr:hypothetical protein [Burkholderiaceae bacterium]
MPWFKESESAPYLILILGVLAKQLFLKEILLHCQRNWTLLEGRAMRAAVSNGVAGLILGSWLAISPLV